MNNIDIIQDWFNRHDITVVSIYILSLVLIEHNYKRGEKEDFIDRYVDTILEYLLVSGKVTGRQRKIYQEQIMLDKAILAQFKDIVMDISNRPNLLQKEKWSSKNLILEQTNRCFPCRKKSNKKGKK